MEYESILTKWVYKILCQAISFLSYVPCFGRYLRCVVTGSDNIKRYYRADLAAYYFDRNREAFDAIVSYYLSGFSINHYPSRVTPHASPLTCQLLFIRFLDKSLIGRPTDISCIIISQFRFYQFGWSRSLIQICKCKMSIESAASSLFISKFADGQIPYLCDTLDEGLVTREFDYFKIPLTPRFAECESPKKSIVIRYNQMFIFSILWCNDVIYYHDVYFLLKYILFLSISAVDIIFQRKYEFRTMEI